MTELTKCDLSLTCERKWEELQNTGDPKVRYCGKCTRGVFAVRTRAELTVASAVGRCVALTDDNEIIGWTGEPEGCWDWMEEESETLRIRFDHHFSEELTDRLRLAFPRIDQAGLALKPGTWITLGNFTEYVAKNLQAELRDRFIGIEVGSGKDFSGHDT